VVAEGAGFGGARPANRKRRRCSMRRAFSARGLFGFVDPGLRGLRPGLVWDGPLALGGAAYGLHTIWIWCVAQWRKGREVVGRRYQFSGRTKYKFGRGGGLTRYRSPTPVAPGPGEWWPRMLGLGAPGLPTASGGGVRWGALSALEFFWFVDPGLRWLRPGLVWDGPLAL